MSHTQSRAGGHQRAGLRIPVLIEKVGEGERRGSVSFDPGFLQSSRASIQSVAGKEYANFPPPPSPPPPRQACQPCSRSSSLPEQAALCEPRAHSAEPLQHRSLAGPGEWEGSVAEAGPRSPSCRSRGARGLPHTGPHGPGSGSALPQASPADGGRAGSAGPGGSGRGSRSDGGGCSARPSPCRPGPWSPRAAGPSWAFPRSPPAVRSAAARGRCRPAEPRAAGPGGLGRPGPARPPAWGEGGGRARCGSRAGREAEAGPPRAAAGLGRDGGMHGTGKSPSGGPWHSLGRGEAWGGCLRSPTFPSISHFDCCAPGAHALWELLSPGAADGQGKVIPCHLFEIAIT